jgi:hypothetical protein
MKFKLLYDDWIRVHPLKRSNKPVITSFNTFNNNNNNKNKIVRKTTTTTITIAVSKLMNMEIC